MGESKWPSYFVVAFWLSGSFRVRAGVKTSLVTGRRSECRTGRMPNAFLGGMPTGWNADSYCPISGGMPKTRGSLNGSMFVAKMPNASDRVRERIYTTGKFLGIYFVSITKT